MAKNPAFGSVSLVDFHRKERDPETQNRMLLEWLSDDEKRAQLFGLISDQGGSLVFPSRVGAREPCCVDDRQPRPPPQTGHRKVRLITSRAEIAEALRDGGKRYSSRPYGDLGGGNFTLAFDPSASAGGRNAQIEQWKALCHAFQYSEDQIARVALFGCESAAVLSLRGPDFDLAEFAEQAVLRFCQGLFGYALNDFRLLEAALRASYRALVYQVLGRHFTTDPLAIPKAKQLAGELLARTAQIIEAHATHDEDALKYCHRFASISDVDPVLKKLAGYAGVLNGEQRAVVALGAAVGTVGNVQAAVCIAVKALLSSTKARDLLARESRSQFSRLHGHWKALIAPVLNSNPPIAFLPRTQVVQGEAGDEFHDVLLALGGGTAELGASAEDLLIWGLPEPDGEPWNPPRKGLCPWRPPEDGKHACFGRPFAWPLIIEAVRYVLGLSDLAERLDPLDGRAIGLEKRWGFAVERYPMSHRRDRRVAQASLNVHMRVRQPLVENVARLREVIRSGAPLIEEVLLSSRHVHFAWFEFIEGDTVLVLHTVYDGDFTSYIEHFALRVGKLFDLLFESIEDPPPAPVDKYPSEFVSLIRRYDRHPAMGYFFSAYPDAEAAEIARLKGRP